MASSTTQNNKPGILILGPLPPVIGGISTHVDHLLRPPLRDQYSLAVLQTMSRKHGNETYESENIILKIAQIGLDAFALIIFLSRKKPGLVHINSSFNSGAFWRDALYLLICKVFRKPVLMQYHGGRLDEFLSGFTGPVKKVIIRILNLPERIVVLSQVQAEPFTGICPMSRVSILPNMINPEEYNYTKRNEADEDKSAGLTIGFLASHLNAEKGIWELLEMMDHVVGKYPGTRLLIAGDGGEIEEMRVYCKVKRIQSYVEFLGFLVKEEIISLLKRLDILVLPSHSEGFPMVILEAMASGVPVAATSVGGIPDILDRGGCGLLFPPGNVNAFLETVEKLLDSKTLRLRFSKKGRERVQRQYSVEVVGKKFADLYKELQQDGK